MPKVADIADTLKPYVWHGVELATNKEGNQVPGDCPFCGKEGKFVVRKDTGQWRCLVCATGSTKGGGNVATFFSSLLDLSRRETRDSDLEALAESRGLLSIDTLKEWGVCKSILTDEWLIPGYSVYKKLTQLYRWVSTADGNLLWPTPGTTAEGKKLGHTLLGVQHFDESKSTVHICEGPWDGMTWWEMLRLCQHTESSFKPTTSSDDCLYADTNIVAVPGCGTFSEVWCRLLDGKDVVLLYDNDHPKITINPKTRKPVQGGLGGWLGMRRVTRLLSESEYDPKSVKYLAWGGSGRNHDPNLKDGYDIRDLLSSGKTSLPSRSAKVGHVYSLLTPVPDDWVPGRSSTASKNGHLAVECLPCTTWKELVNDWRKAMKWTEGLDRTLSIMLACIISTPLSGDQIWIKVVSPPSTGKSTLCEALAVAKKYVVAKSKIRGFHSGYQKDKEGKENSSLLADLQDKTLIIKDGDSFFQAPNLGEILAEARDLYDRVSRSHYRNKMGKDWEGVNLTWILCVTPEQGRMDTSELGQRFLDCVIMDGIEDEFEKEIGRRASNDMIYLLQNPLQARGRDGESGDMLLAKQRTGGYVNHLRKEVEKKVAKIKMSESIRDKCENLGRLIALMRARPSKKQDEEVTRELSARLIKQLVKLSFCVAVVLNKTEVDDEVLRRVARVAWDTSRGRSVNIVRHLYHAGDNGSQLKTLCLYTHQPAAKEHNLLRFLKKINVVEVHMFKPPRHQLAKPFWRLTDYMREIYSKALGE